jgi:hypothetical protein
MRIDAGLLKDILEQAADHGYSGRSMGIDQIKLEDVPKDKLEFHVVHLIKEGYFEGVAYQNWGRDLQIDRITDKGMLLLNAVESSAFQKWVKEKSGEAADTLWKTSAGMMWAYVKQWLAEKGLSLPQP